MIILETERLLHRKVEPEDLETIIKFRSDDDVSKYLGGERVKTREFNTARLKFYLETWEKYGFGSAIIILKETGEEIGWSGLQPLEETGEIEVGYALIKKYWHRGIGFETAEGWLDFGFGTANLDRIVADPDPANTASQRIMEKCGMKYEKTETHYGSNCVFYAVNREDYLRREK